VAVVLLIAAAGCALASVASASDARGAFPLRLVNGTHGRWSDRQIYVTVLGIGSSGRWSYLRPDGTMAPLDHTMASAPGHLEKDGHPYPNMSFTLARARTVMLPATIVGARIYISVGSPMFLAVNASNSGWAGPDLLDPSDPNHDVYFDWYELTYQYRVIPFGGNTTQVDMFGLPLVVRLQQRSSGCDRVTGIRANAARGLRPLPGGRRTSLSVAGRSLSDPRPAYRAAVRPGRSRRRVPEFGDRRRVE